MEKIIVINQKMYFNSLAEIHKFQDLMKNFKNDVVILPSNIYLKDFIDKNFVVGAQDIFAQDSGAYTGQVSAAAVSDLGAKYVLIGHHEVRNNVKDDFVQDKIDRAIENNLIPILCVGEDILDYESGFSKDVIKGQLIDLVLPDNIIIAYEPIWSIGSKETPSVDHIEKIINYIKSFKNVPVLYGGGVSFENISLLCDVSCIAGFLIGSGSLDVSCLKKIIEVVLK